MLPSIYPFREVANMEILVYKLLNLQVLIENQMMSVFWNKLKDNISDPALWTKVLLIFIQIVVILIVGRVIVRLANKAMAHMMVERERKHLKFDQRRTNTIGRLLGNIITYTVNFITILLIL
jgi:small-conductance mechanosensitive channel